jgi:arginase
MGGDHSVASSSVLAALQKFRNLHVIWIDAHPDIHTYTSTVSGNKHGTPLSVCTGLEKTHWASRISLKQLSFDRLIYVGIRDIDDFEAETIKKYNIRHYTPQQAIDFMRENS